MDFDYLSIINHLTLSQDLTELFDAVETFYSARVKRLKDELLKIIPADKHELFNDYMNAINGHVIEIRNNDCSKAFYEGMKFGIGFQQFLDNPLENFFNNTDED